MNETSRTEGERPDDCGEVSAERRRLIKLASAAAATGLVGATLGPYCTAALAQAPAAAQHVSEHDPTAMALGYADDTSRVDQNKFAKHTVDQVCSKCNFYSGAAGSNEGPCLVFQGKLVAARGGCSSYTPKA